MSDSTDMLKHVAQHPATKAGGAGLAVLIIAVQLYGIQQKIDKLTEQVSFLRGWIRVEERQRYE